ncbi:MAG: hypothetical protein OEV21_01330 [Thermoplasmata archaeon]|nr:hypothetical protein [Thermoplasmata archaeon]
MFSDQAVISIPYRLAISGLIISLTIPICLQSIAQIDAEMSRLIAQEIASDVKKAIETASYRYPGESRLLSIGSRLNLLNIGLKIIIGDRPGGENSHIITCRDGTGWQSTALVELGGSVAGICSPHYSSVILEKGSRDVLVEHSLTKFGDMIMVVPT